MRDGLTLQYYLSIASIEAAIEMATRTRRNTDRIVICFCEDQYYSAQYRKCKQELAGGSE